MKYTEDQIDAYVRGEMSVPEMADFEAEMERDPALAREVDMIRLIVSGLKDRQDKLDAMNTWQKDAERKSASRTISTGKRHAWGPWVAVLGAAAAVVVGVFLYRPLPTPLPQAPEPPAMRSAGLPSLDSLIEQGDYQSAIEVIEAELAETDSLLQESIRIREEADYDIEKYEWVIRSLNQKLDQIRNMQNNR
jgi:hypothetical protein